MTQKDQAIAGKAAEDGVPAAEPAPSQAAPQSAVPQPPATPAQAAAAQPALSVVPPAPKPIAAPPTLIATRGFDPAPLPLTGAAPAHLPARQTPAVFQHSGGTVRMPASSSRLRRRHVGLIASFLLMVLLPLLVSTWYMFFRAVDQYASTLGFSVHQEDGGGSALELLSGISGLSSVSGSSSPDTDVIYTYIYSQELVAEIDAELDLRSIWSTPANDFFFRFDETGTIEDLVDYWADMVKVHYDSTTRLIEVRVLAFDPRDAQRISEAIFTRSTEMINRMNDMAVEDAVSHARSELEKTHQAVIEARQEMTVYRNRYQIVDPEADLTAQMTVVGSLQEQLAAAEIELQLLKETSVASDQRLIPIQRRIRVIEERIKVEKAKLGLGLDTGGGEAAAAVIAEYERLAADREFTETSYLAARATYDAALAEVSRRTRYLAAHVKPTLAESSRYPERGLLLGVLGVLLVMIWSILVLIFYSARDRR